MLNINLHSEYIFSIADFGITNTFFTAVLVTILISIFAF